jgi:hypothetical protein
MTLNLYLGFKYTNSVLGVQDAFKHLSNWFSTIQKEISLASSFMKLFYLYLSFNLNKIIFLSMKTSIICLFAIVLMALSSTSIFAQKNITGANTITASDLESHLSFLASPLLKGRMNGEEGLDIAARYIASQAKKIGLKPAGGTDYYHPYTVIKKSIDLEKSYAKIADGKDSIFVKEPLFQLVPMGASDLEIDGDVIFAGYGINASKYKYNDLDSLDMAGKILLIMNRAPSSPDGKKCLFEDQKWMGITGLQMKLQFMMFGKPKAILIVTDPKSGFSSLEEAMPDLAGYMKSNLTLKGQKSQTMDYPGMPKIIFIHRKVADEILKGTGKNLADLQNSIDNEFKPHSFLIKGKQLKIKEVSRTEEKSLPNVAGIVEGSDPILKNEVVIFSGHMDHLGVEGGKVYPGADDNASGCVALLEMAEAFQSLPKKPLRTVMFLWVSGEEVGLFGSESYVNNPVFPLEKTVADLNMDMIGRVKGVADTSKQNPMTGPNAVFVITDNQSKELISIADQVAKKTNLTLDYSLSGRTHPLQLFARSDHYNFVQKDIPILFFTTGLHTTYHTPEDVIDKIDFQKLELVTRTMYEIGFQVANKKIRIVVDNPFSKSKSSSTIPK